MLGGKREDVRIAGGIGKDVCTARQRQSRAVSPDAGPDRTEAGPAAQVRGVLRVQAEAPEGVPPRDRPRRLQEGMAGTGLCDHHRRGAQDPRERPPGGSQAPHVVRPSAHEDGRRREMTLSAPDYAKVFNRLCHFVALSKEGKTKEAIDHLVQTVFVINSPNFFVNTQDVKRAIYDYYGLQLSASSINDSIGRLQSDGIILHTTSDNVYRLTDHAQAAIEKRISDAANLEEAVKTEWLAEIERFVPEDLSRHSDKLWKCLLSYMSKAFRRHGVETIRFLSSEINVAPSDLKTLSSFLNEAISQECGDMRREIVVECIRLFFARQRQNEHNTLCNFWTERLHFFL